MKLVRNIAYNTIISFLGRVVCVALSLVNIGLIARYLGQEGYGSYALILAFLSIFNNLADFGLYSLMTREISRPGADEKKIASNIFTLRIVILLLFLSLAIGLVWFFPYPVQVKIGIAIASVGFLFLSASQVMMGIFQKYLSVDKPALAEFIGRIVQIGIILFCIENELSLFYILGALVVSSFFIFIINFLFARGYIRFSLAFNFSYWKKVLKTALPIAASIVLTLIYFKIDSIFLSLDFINRGSSNPIRDVGIYNISYKILESLIFFPSMFVGLIMPLLSKFAIANIAQFKKVFQSSLNLLIIIVIPLVVGLVLLSNPIVVFIGGENFFISGSVLKILALAIGLIYLGSLFSNSIIALNKQKAGAWIYFIGMIFNIITNLIFIPKYSYLGAAFTTVLTEFLVTVLMLILVYRTISYFPSFKTGPKSIFASLLMGGFIYYFQQGSLFLVIGASILIYLVILYFIKGIAKEDIILLTKKSY